MPWKTVYRNKREVKTERAVVLLLGGSIFDDSGLGVQIINRRRRGGDDHLLKPQDVHLEEHLWQRDFHTITSFFERANVTIWRCVPTRMRSDRNEALQLIREFFQLDRQTVPGERRTFIIYWCGHGTPGSGNWGFSKGGDITCRDIINSWNFRLAAPETDPDTSYLTIIADTCFAGEWIEPLRAENIPRLAYQAASRTDESAFVVNDGNVPRSLLMRKFIIEQTFPVSWYTWTCVKQHPMYLCNYAETEDGSDLSEGQRRCLVRGGPFYFFAVDRPWTWNGKMSTRERKAELNKLAKYGTFIENV